MRRERLIGFAGRKRSGKGVLAQLMRDKYNAKIFTVADYLKFLSCDLLKVEYDTLNSMKDNNMPLNVEFTEKWCRFVAKKTGISVDDIMKIANGIVIKDVRHLLQFLGTDIIRKFKPEWHVEQLVNDIKSYDEDTIIVVDDVRFPNERKVIEKLGGEVFYIIRPSWNDISNHISETSLKWQDFDITHVIINDCNIESYKAQFEWKYNNGINISIPNGIFLSDNTEMLDEYKQYITTEHTNPLIKETLKLYKQ